MNRNIAKPFTATLSLLDVASDRTHKYKCFHGEDIQLTVNVVGEEGRRINLSNTSVKIYFTLDKNVNEPVYRQDAGIMVGDSGVITVMLEKSYIRIGNNVLKIVLYDEDQTVFLQPLIISCIDPLISEAADLEIPDDINVGDEIYDIRRIIGDLEIEIIEARNGYRTVGRRLDNFDSQLEYIENVKAEKTEVQILKNRVDSFTSLDEGSTTGDAELIDGRNTFFGTTDNNIGEAIRKQMNAVYNGVYYLDVAWELGEMDSPTGENGNTINPTQIRSKDFISIPLNVDIKFELSTNYNYFILKYNENKIYQGYEGVYTSGTNILNTNCPYIKIAMANHNFDTNVNIEMGSNLKSYFEINSFKDIDVRNCYLVCQEHSKKVYVDTFNKTITIPPSFICLSNKLLKATNEQIINYTNTNEYRWLYYNKTSDLIEYTTFYKDDSNYYFLGLFYPDMPRNSYCNFKFVVDKPQSIGCLGDSITYGLGGTSWTTKLSELCNIPTVYNYGVSGTTIITNGTTGFIDRIPNMVKDLDVIILWGGVNDFMWTNQSKEVFKANFEKVVKALLDKYPKAKIVGLTPMKFKYTASADGILTRAWNEPNSQSGVLLKDYVDVEIEIFNKYSIEYKDLFNESGISCEHNGQANEYFVGNGDLLHPNEKGNLLVLAPKIANKINSLL